MTNIFFSADYHFSHNKVIEYENRPFSSVEEMNETILENLNNSAKRNDHLYFLGDFSWGNYDIIDRINCKVHLIKGNHDDSIPRRVLEKFESVNDLKYLRIGEGSSWTQCKMMLCHYPMVTWRAKDHGSFMLHGHSHGNYRPSNPFDFIMDVGVDCWNFHPVSLDVVLNIMNRKRELRDYSTLKENKNE